MPVAQDAPLPGDTNVACTGWALDVFVPNVIVNGQPDNKQTITVTLQVGTVLGTGTLKGVKDIELTLEGFGVATKSGKTGADGKWSTTVDWDMAFDPADMNKGTYTATAKLQNSSSLIKVFAPADAGFCKAPTLQDTGTASTSPSGAVTILSQGSGKCPKSPNDTIPTVVDNGTTQATRWYVIQKAAADGETGTVSVFLKGNVAPSTQACCHSFASVSLGQNVPPISVLPEGVAMAGQGGCCSGMGGAFDLTMKGSPVYGRAFSVQWLIEAESEADGCQGKAMTQITDPLDALPCDATTVWVRHLRAACP